MFLSELNFIDFNETLKKIPIDKNIKANYMFGYLNTNRF